MQVIVKAISSFEHGGARRRGSEFTVSEAIANQLVRNQLVEVLGQAPESAEEPAREQEAAAAKKAQGGRGATTRSASK